MRPLAFLLLLCSLAACSSGRGNGAVDGGNPRADGGGLDGGALDGGSTDGGLSGTHCTSPADCPSSVCNTCAELCETTTTAACVEDVNCNILEAHCDPCTGHCRANVDLCGACTADRDCGQGNRCLSFDGGARGCGRDCSALTCPTGYVCSDEGSGVKQCRPCAGACNAPGACTEDNDCPFRSFCNVGPGHCPACAAGCSDDLQCAGGLVCHDNGRCTGSCPGTPCPSGYTCTDGHCKLPGACVANADCRELADPPHYCDLGTHRCVPGCDEDNDCLLVAETQGSLCDRGLHQCVPRPCTGTFQCAYQQFCNTGSGQCYDAGGSYCLSCQGDNDCACGAGSTCPSGPNHCLEITDADGGSLGKFCFVGGCNPDGGINTGCPQGFACHQMPTPDGQGTFPACQRNCADIP